MNEFPYMQLWVNDLMNDPKVAIMSTLAFGAYCKLLFKYAWHQKPVGTLPDDDAVLARWAELSAAEWAKVKAPVLSCFKKRGGRWVQTRMQDEYKKIVQNRDEKSQNASKAANAKHRKDRESRAAAVRTQCEAHANTDTESESETYPRLKTADNSPADAGIDFGVKLELAMAGVGEPKLSELGRRLTALNATALDVRLAWIDTQAAKKGAGWLIRKLEGGVEAPRLTVRRVIDLVNAGHIVRIDGNPVAKGWVGCQRDALCIFDRKCTDWHYDHRPPPVCTIGIDAIDADAVTLSGHEKNGENHAA